MSSPAFDPTLYFVTDTALCGERGVVETVRSAVAGGVTCVQVRAKDAPAAEFLALVTAVADAVGDQVPVLVNDRVDVYLAALARGAAVRGVHVGQNDLPLEIVREIVGGDAIVGWNIDQIKDMGIDVEIDDFGTGYASIVSLQKLRPTRLKIDRQLVNPILTDPGQRQLLASIVDIGKSMGIGVVAEGVETMEHAAILRDLGCDILQGYAFSRPLSPEALEIFLSTKAWLKAS